MKFRGIKRAVTYTQINHARPELVFPLLCPVKEKDWIDGWDYEMIFSKSGLIEEGCVFSTPHHGKEPTIWYVNKHDRENYKVEFVRVCPGEEVVKIIIDLIDNNNGTTSSIITYEYTGLNESKNKWIKNELDKDFKDSMIWWEKAINHFLKTGTQLKKS